ncbi:NB-ARC [Arabidopsis thaliana x Arabidopsis arenosa]|uniref:NB-ARC n=1 Tax=Arabidopsis thaliana x Arabidopsis arenosa TaxID=1240361 RepID=A0A8T1XF58_9BRAS|nr:NB-ARC [Arabidopsis thaliana x Arabidopsis arenosa]
MGNFVSFSISVDEFVPPFLRYLCCNNLEDNLDALTHKIQDLQEMRDDLLRWVSKEEDSRLQMLSEVNQWFSRVGEVESRANRLLEERFLVIGRLSMYGYCSLLSASTYRYSEKVSETLEQVKTLKWERVFEVVSEKAPRMESRPTFYQPVGSREELFKTTWAHLMDEHVGTLGIYGMGGVGKTTLLAQINNKFSELGDDLFVLIYVVVASNEAENIQDEIGSRLGLQWERETKMEKAVEIFNVLKRNRFVLLLDDIGRKVDLAEIGVPYPQRENGCKIVFTSRSREACQRMMVDAEVEVKCLVPNEAWDLFKEIVGEIALASHPDIAELARIVAVKCFGLPLALRVIGNFMSTKRTVQEWRHAIYLLNSNKAEFCGVEDRIIPILKLSYDTLPSEKIKSCFIYCALFPQGFVIRKQDLVKYWVGERLISHEFKGYEIIGYLVRASLLIEDGSGYGVQMHELVREMALWIASVFGTQIEHRFVVLAGVGLKEMPKLKHWSMVKRVSLTSNQLQNITDSPDCSELTTLFLQDNNLKSIVGSFFRSMGSLVVLDLSRNPGLTELPEEVSMLVALRYLSLLGTGIKDLPHGLLNLTQLIHLDLESTPNLGSISLISGLLKLQVLRFYDSAAALDTSLLEELERLKHLGFLTITVREIDVLKAFLGSKLAGCTQGLYLQGLRVSGVSFAATFGALGGLHKLEMVNCDIIESDTYWEAKRRHQDFPSTSSNQITQSSPWFKNLLTVELFSCKGLRDLTWLIFAENLESLSIALSHNLEELISETKAVGVRVEPFQKLQVLRLEYLDALKSIYWSPLSFPRLKKLVIKNCRNLHKLPLNSTSVAIIYDLHMEVEKEWLEEVEWENGAKERFLPVIRTASVSQLHPV